MSNSVLDEHHQQAISSAIQWAAEIQQRVANEAMSVEENRGRPFMLLRPRIYPDGNQWCALYGENIQEGVCGFGDTPELASRDFDKSWHSQKLLQVKGVHASDCAVWVGEKCGCETGLRSGSAFPSAEAANV